MEMVEAIIDNNYDVNDVNLQQSKTGVSSESGGARETSARYDESNFETVTTSLRAPLKAQLPKAENNENLSDKKWQRRVHRKGTFTTTMMMMQFN